MNPINAKVRIAGIMALNTWEHRRGAKRMPLLSANAKEAEQANKAAVTELGLLALYEAELEVLEGIKSPSNEELVQISAVDPHTRVISAVIEMIYPLDNISATNLGADIVTTNSGAKFLEAVAELRELHTTNREDGRTWWPIVNTHTLQMALEWLASLGPDPWGRKLQQVEMRWSVLPGGRS